MRITNRTINNNMLLNLNRGLQRLDRINTQLGSKKQVNVPSDDPVKAGVILRMNSSIAETEQYIRNNEAAISWLDASDVVFKDVIEVIHRAKELANRGATDSQDSTSRQALADEIAQLHDSLIQLANSTHGGRYLFAGQQTQTLPFVVDPDFDPEDGGLPTIIYEGDEAEIKFEIGVNVTMGVNMKGDKLFPQIFEALGVVYNQLVGEEPDPDATPLDDFDNVLDDVLQHMSELGGKQNRVDFAHERLLDMRLNLIKVLSEAQDLDYSEAIMDLKMEEFAYRTALSVGARIIQPSLIDFLR